MKILSAPKELFIALTDRCNLSCKHCNVWSTRSSGKELSLEEWKRVIDEAVRLKVFFITISGGEPFLRGDVFEVIRYVDATHMHYSINTNATLIDRNAALRLAGLTKMDNLLIGLDGSMPETHDALRGEGAFIKGIKGIRHLVDAIDADRITLFCVVNKFNMRDLEGVARLTEELSINGVQFEPLLWEGNARVHRQQLALDYKETQSVYKTVAALHRSYGAIIGGNYLKMERHFGALDAFDFEQFQQFEKGAYLSACAAFDKLVVRPDGLVVPCDRMWEYTVGSIRDTTLKDIWYSAPKLNEFRDRFTRHVDDIDDCKGCRYRFACQAGCPAAALNAKGTLYARDDSSCYRIHKGEEAYG